MIDQNSVAIYGPAVADPIGYGKKFIQDLLDTTRPLGPTMTITYDTDDTHHFFQFTLEGAKEHAKDNHDKLAKKGLQVVYLFVPSSENKHLVWKA